MTIGEHYTIYRFDDREQVWPSILVVSLQLLRLLSYQTPRSAQLLDQVQQSSRSKQRTPMSTEMLPPRQHSTWIIRPSPCLMYQDRTVPGQYTRHKRSCPLVHIHTSSLFLAPSPLAPNQPGLIQLGHRSMQTYYGSKYQHTTGCLQPGPSSEIQEISD